MYYKFVFQVLVSWRFNSNDSHKLFLTIFHISFFFLIDWALSNNVRFTEYRNTCQTLSDSLEAGTQSNNVNTPQTTDEEVTTSSLHGSHAEVKFSHKFSATNSTRI